MTTIPKISTTAIALTFALTSAVSAKPALKDVTHVRDGLIAVGIAYEISEECGRISARLFRGIGYLNSLKAHARDLGYSNGEIDAYTDDKAEQRRLEGIARAQLAGLGAVVGNEASYCQVGRAEIAKGSAIGRLLR